MQMLISAVKGTKGEADLVLLFSWDSLLSFGHPGCSIVLLETQLRLNICKSQECCYRCDVVKKAFGVSGVQAGLCTYL